MPVYCYAAALWCYGRYRVFRRLRHARFLFELLHAHYLLIKGQRYEISGSRLLAAVEKAIGHEFAREGPGHSCLNGKGKVSDAELQFLKNTGGIVLKVPRFGMEKVVEKGALLLKFGENFRSFCECVDVASALRDYVLVLEPGWSALANPGILYFTRFADHPVVVMATEKRDYQFLERLGSNLIPVRYGDSDWVNPSIFYPIEGQKKKYDAVMVSSWLSFKRHHVLFRTLRNLKDPSFRVALASHMSRNREEIELLIDAYGVRDNLDVFEGLSQKEVNEILNQSRVNLLLSLQEGGNRSLFEGFFAGVPGLALENNVGLQKDYFTPQTGKLISEKDLVPQLLYFREHWSDFDPRPWAEANISPEVTTAKLNELLKKLALERGEEWTVDLAAKCNSPNLAYYPDESAGEGFPSMEDIIVRYARGRKVRDASYALRDF